MFMSAQKRFTLLEMLVMASVTLILVTMALPNFGATVKGNRELSEIDTLYNALVLARDTATRSGSDVMVCASADGRNCANGTWSAGYTVKYVTAPLNSPAVIHRFRAMDGTTTLVSSINGRIVFHADGRTDLPGPITFTLCDSRGVRDARALDLLVSGVPKASTILGRDVNGQPLACS